MSLGAVEQLKVRGIELLRNEKGNEIYMSLFEDWKSMSDVSKEIYPHLYKKKANRKYKNNRNKEKQNNFLY